MWIAQHRGEEGKLTTPDGGEGFGKTHLPLNLAGDATRGEEEERSSNGIIGA
jgi:hypothetical protein